MAYLLARQKEKENIFQCQQESPQSEPVTTAVQTVIPPLPLLQYSYLVVCMIPKGFEYFLCSSSFFFCALHLAAALEVIDDGFVMLSTHEVLLPTSI